MSTIAATASSTSTSTTSGAGPDGEDSRLVFFLKYDGEVTLMVQTAEGVRDANHFLTNDEEGSAERTAVLYLSGEIFNHRIDETPVQMPSLSGIFEKCPNTTRCNLATIRVSDYIPNAPTRLTTMILYNVHLDGNCEEIAFLNCFPSLAHLSMHYVTTTRFADRHHQLTIPLTSMSITASYKVLPETSSGTRFRDHLLRWLVLNTAPHPPIRELFVWEIENSTVTLVEDALSAISSTLKEKLFTVKVGHHIAYERLCRITGRQNNGQNNGGHNNVMWTD